MPPVGVMTPERSFSVVVLPAPLGPRKATNSPCSTRQVDAANRLDVAVLPAEQPPNRGPQPFPLLIDAVGLRQPFDLDDGHDRTIIEGAEGGRGRVEAEGGRGKKLDGPGRTLAVSQESRQPPPSPFRPPPCIMPAKGDPRHGRSTRRTRTRHPPPQARRSVAAGRHRHSP